MLSRPNHLVGSISASVLFIAEIYPTWTTGLFTHFLSFFVLAVQSPSCVRLFATTWIAARRFYISLSFPISWSLFKFMSTESMMTSNHLTLCRPLLLLPSIFPSIRVFSNESAVRIRWPKYWNFCLFTTLNSFAVGWWFPFLLMGEKGAVISILIKGEFYFPENTIASWHPRNSRPPHVEGLVAQFVHSMLDQCSQMLFPLGYRFPFVRWWMPPSTFWTMSVKTKPLSSLWR